MLRLTSNMKDAIMHITRLPLKVIVLLSLLSTLVTAQDFPAIEWQNTFGGTASDDAYSLQATSDGGYIVGGRSLSNSSADKDEDNLGSGDYWVVKLDSVGNIEWENTLGGTGDDRLIAVKQTADGGYILGGYSPSDSSADKSEDNLGNDDYWVVKLDAAGNIEWDNTLGGTGDDELYSIEQTTDGGYILGGRSNSISSPDKTENNLGGYDNWIVKLDNSGNIVWDQTIGGTANEAQGKIIQTSDDGYFVFSLSNSNISADKTENSMGSDYWVVKMDALGNIVWDNTIGGSGNDVPSWVEQTQDGGYILSGISYSDVSGDKSEPNNNGDLWIVKLDASGSIQWENTIGSNIFEFQVDNSNNITQTFDGGYVVAVTSSVCDVPSGDISEVPPPLGTNCESPWIAKLDENGVVQWDNLIISSDQTFEDISIIQSDDGGFVVSCSNSSDAGFDKTEDNIGAFDFWVFKLACPFYTDTVINTISPVSQRTCKLATPQIINGTDDDNLFEDEIFYQWQISSDSTTWDDVSGATLRNFLPLSTSADVYYRRVVSWGCDHGDTSNVHSLSVDNDVAPKADGGGTFNTCVDSSVIIGGSPTGIGGTGTLSYAWDNANLLNDSTIANPLASVNTSTVFTVTVTDSLGCRKISQAVVLVISANAGSDVNYCAGSSGVLIGSPPITGLDATYSWSPSQGLSDSTIARPVASPDSATEYILTINFLNADSLLCELVDIVTVTVTMVSPPDTNFAGLDTVLCLLNGSAILGSPAAGGLSYVWSPGKYLNNVTLAQPTFNSGTLLPVPNPIMYQVKAFSSGCSFTDEVEVAVIVADAGEDVCGPGIIGVADILGGLADYKWNVVSGPGYVDNDSISQTFAYTNGGVTDFELVASYNGTSCRDTMTLEPCGNTTCEFDIEASGAFGCPKVFDDNPFSLTAVKTNTSTALILTDYAYQWSPTIGLTNPNNYTTEVTDDTESWYYLTITNILDSTIFCVDSIFVNGSTWNLPVFSASVDQYICLGEVVGIGNSHIAGDSYSWTVLGNATVISTAANPSVSPAFTTTYVVTAGNSGSACSIKDTTTVIVQNVVADAGADLTICDAALIQLGTSDPSGGLWTYEWVPGNASWQNGTDSSFAQPEALVAITQQYVVIVTNPNTGCSDSDIMTVTLDTDPQILDAPDEEICPGGSVQIGSPALPGVAYSWLPTLGLSDPNTAQTFASPTNTTAYTVFASFPPGTCVNIPIDVVTVTVFDPSFDLGPDAAYCPVDGFDIGGSAPTTGVSSYAWSPSTGLNCINCANPVATPVDETTYLLIVTYTNGCVGRDTITLMPISDPEAGFDRYLCFGDSISVGSASNTGSIAWTGSGTAYLDNIMSPTPVFNSQQSGVGVFTLILAQNVSSCVANDTVLITVVDAPTVNVTPAVAACIDGCVEIGVTAEPGLSYSWVPTSGLDDPTSSITLVCPDSTTVYELRVEEVVSGCITTEEVTVTVTADTAPSVSVDDVTTCLATEFTFNTMVSPTDTGSYSYAWSPTTGLNDPFIEDPTAIVNNSTTYTLTLIDNVTGCSSTSEAEVTVVHATEELVVAINSINEVCAGGSITLDATVTASNLQNLQWSSNGDGVFSPSDSVEDPSYLMGVVDSTNGFVSLTLDAIGVCLTASESALLQVGTFTVQTFLDSTICQGDSVVIGPSIYTSSGSFMDTFSTNQGCDSIVNINVMVLVVDTMITIDSTICAGESVTIGTNIYTEAGSFVDTIECDRIIALNLTVTPSDTTVIDTSICLGDTLIIEVLTLSSSGTFTIVYEGSNGCDSLVMVNLDILFDETILDTTICSGDTVIVGSSTYTSAGTFVDTLMSSDGCDSIVTLNLIVNSDPCDVFNSAGAFYDFESPNPFNDKTGNGHNPTNTPDASISEDAYFGTGAYDGNTNSIDLDNYPLMESAFVQKSVTMIIKPDALNVTQALYEEGGGTNGIVLKLQNTGDLVLSYRNGGAGTQTDITFPYPTDGEWHQVGFVYDGSGGINLVELYIDGVVVATNVALGTLAAHGGDGGLFKTVDNDASGTSTSTHTYLGLADNAAIYSTALTSADMQDALSCMNTFRYDTICAGDSIVVGNSVYTQTGTYLDTLGTSLCGIDSFILSHVTVCDICFDNPGDTTVCNYYVLPPIAGSNLNGTEAYYTGSGGTGTQYMPGDTIDASLTVYIYAPPVADTCAIEQSFIVTVLGDLVIIDTTICSGDSIVVGDSVYLESGTYSDTLMTANGCDSIINLNLTVLTTDTMITIDSTICQGDSVTLGLKTFDESGSYSDTLACNQIFTLNLTVLVTDTTLIDTSICAGDTVFIEGLTLASAGTYSITYIDSDGCDSIVFITLSIKPTIETNIDTILCEGDSLIVGSSVYTMSGSFMDTLNALNGCDSIITLNLSYSVINMPDIPDTIFCSTSDTAFSESFSIEDIFTGYFEGFESGQGTWTQGVNGVDDDFDWTRDSEGTSSFPTGPDEGSNGSTWYMYTEASPPAFTGATYMIVSQVFDLSLGSYTLSFDYHMYGSTIGALAVEVSTNGSTWTEIWSLSGNQGNAWNSASLDMSAYSSDNPGSATVQIRFIGTRGGDFTGDIAIDSISLSNSFLITWSTGDTGLITTIDTTVVPFGTSKTFTLTISDTITGCQEIDSFIVTNLLPTATTLIDSNICLGDTMFVGSQGFDSSGSYEIFFLGASGCDSIVFLNLTVFPVFSMTIDTTICEGESIVIGSSVYTTTGTFVDILMTVSGCDSIITLNLIVRSLNTPDIADTSYCFLISEIISIDSAFLSYSEGFESGLGTWTQGVNGVDDDRNWTRDAGGTPTSSTGPISGSNGSTWYMYTETSPTAEGETFMLISQVFDLSATMYEFSFDYSMRGFNMGTLAVEVSTDGSTWTELWSLSGNLGVFTYQNAKIDLAEYSVTNIGSSTVQFRFIGTAGNGIRSDMAIDNISITHSALVIWSTGDTSLSTIIDSTDVPAGTSTTFTVTLLDTVMGCQSTDSFTITNLSPIVSTSIDTAICFGDTMRIGGFELTTSDTFLLIFGGVNNCDSSVTLILTVNLDSIYIVLYDTICAGDSIVVGNSVYTQTGTYLDTLGTSPCGIDSFILSHVTVCHICFDNPGDTVVCTNYILPPITGSNLNGTETYYTGSGGTDTQFMPGDTIYASLTMYIYAPPVVDTCAKEESFLVSIIGADTLTIDTTMCFGDTLTIAGIDFTSNGTFIDTLLSSNGCDSIITIIVSVESCVDPDTIVVIISPGDSAEVCIDSLLQLGGGWFSAGYCSDTSLNVIINEALTNGDSCVSLTAPVDTAGVIDSLCIVHCYAIGSDTLYDTTIVIVIIPCTQIDIQVLLEGSYIDTGMMRTDLNDNYLLPGQDLALNPNPLAIIIGNTTPVGQPYNRLPWNYTGIEGDKYGDSTTNSHPDLVAYASDIVDWVLVSVRENDSLATSVIWRCAGLLHSDGKVEFPDECDCLNASSFKKYYLVVEHRNHLPMMTSSLQLVDGKLSYDFRIQDTWILELLPEFFLGVGQKNQGSDYMMYAGNGEQIPGTFDRRDVISGDNALWFSETDQSFSYRDGDYDMNTDVNPLDNVLWSTNAGVTGTRMPLNIDD